MKPAPSTPPAKLAETLAIHDRILGLLAHADEREGSLTSLLQELELLAADHPHRASLLRAIHRALAIGKRLEQHKQNELSLRAVSESAQALTELKELSQLLAEIVERGRQLLGSDLAWLAGVDPNGKLFVRAISGILSDDTRKLNPTSNVGVAGDVLRTRSPFSTHDYLGDPRFEQAACSNMTPGATASSPIPCTPTWTTCRMRG